LTKCNNGEEFPDLDLLSKLLAPVPFPKEPPQIEVLSKVDELGEHDKELSELTENLSISNPEIRKG
jgi:protein SHQ1